MDPATAFSLAHESLGICIAVGKRIKNYIETDRNALDDVATLDSSVSLALQNSKSRYCILTLSGRNQNCFNAISPTTILHSFLINTLLLAKQI